MIHRTRFQLLIANIVRNFMIHYGHVGKKRLIFTLMGNNVEEA